MSTSPLDSTSENEADIDREIRVERMKRELEELSGGAMISGSMGDMPPELEEVFLERACALLRGFCLWLQRRIQSGSARSQ